MSLRNWILPIVLLTAGCASTYQRNDVVTAEGTLDREKGVLVSIPKDGWYGTTQYFGSGSMTAIAVEAAFSKNASRVDLVTNCHGESCLESIDTKSYGYYVKPEILHWEEQATVWSGLPDRIEIQLVIYDVESKRQLANSTYTGKSKRATFGGDHPQDLLAAPTNEYVSSLYR